MSGPYRESSKPDPVHTCEETIEAQVIQASHQAMLQDRVRWPEVLRMSSDAYARMADELNLMYRHPLTQPFAVLCAPTGVLRVFIDDTLPPGEWRIE